MPYALAAFFLTAALSVFMATSFRCTSFGRHSSSRCQCFCSPAGSFGDSRTSASPHRLAQGRLLPLPAASSGRLPSGRPHSHSQPLLRVPCLHPSFRLYGSLSKKENSHPTTIICKALYLVNLKTINLLILGCNGAAMVRVPTNQIIV